MNEFPIDDNKIWWEIWIRNIGDRETYLNFFRSQAERLGLAVDSKETWFPERNVISAFGSKSQISRSIDLLNSIAELRKTKETADFFTSLTTSEQHDWINDALRKISWKHGDGPAVCLLDTGVNNGHPLLLQALSSTDMHSYEPAWNVADHKGHGTEMAGLAMYGDLTDLLASNSPMEIRHRLESVKILPPKGANAPHLYGAIITEAVARPEITAPKRQRVICLTIAAPDFHDRGQPSEWSASLDVISSGADDGKQRLIVVSAGNTDINYRHNYPYSKETDSIHDPGQSWNALTVGAFTDKISMDQKEYPGWKPIAPESGLSPSSCTSMSWGKPWPIKPDIVMEGGNMAIDPVSGKADYVDSLQLLSTNWQFTLKPLVTTGDTSAATALAARMAAILQVEYPDFWPETIRALLVHSADWAATMKSKHSPLNLRKNVQNILRLYGFGVPSFDLALWSARNSLTLIAQETLQPFDKFQKEFKSRDINIHSIPWPVETLQDLGATPVEMRITLSYFIEPNPGRRGWRRKYSYASHGLRFEVKTPTETLNQFRQRINKAAIDEESGTKSRGDHDRWVLGPILRGLGSLHSDRWRGTAAELAQMGYLAVYPVLGWWRERHSLKRWNKKARYALIISITAPETEVDIYTPVANLIKTPISVG